MHKENNAIKFSKEQKESLSNDPLNINAEKIINKNIF